MPAEKDASRADLRVSWRIVAITTSLFALMCLTTTVIVATTKEADTLSTVALGLAVIAFVIQIIVYIVQAEAANRQQLSFQEVYGSTIEALAKIEEKAEVTRREVNILSVKMLDAALNNALPAAIEKGIPADSPELYDKIKEALHEVVNASIGPGSRLSSINLSRSDEPAVVDLPGLEDPNLTEWSFPSPTDTQVAYPDLAKLSDTSLGALYRLADDHIRYRYRSSEFSGVGLSRIDGSDTLFEAGLVHRSVPHWTDTPVDTLTPKGITAAKVLTAKPAPDSIGQEILDIRSRGKAAYDEWQKSRPRRRLRRRSGNPD